MSFLTRASIYILANSAAIWAADRLISGFVFQGDFKDLLIAGAVLGIVNSLIKPLVKLVTFPIILLTLGLFTVIINIALLIFVSNLLPGLAIQSLWAAFWGVIVISVTNHIILSVIRDKEE